MRWKIGTRRMAQALLSPMLFALAGLKCVIQLMEIHTTVHETGFVHGSTVHMVRNDIGVAFRMVSIRRQ